MSTWILRWSLVFCLGVVAAADVTHPLGFALERPLPTSAEAVLADVTSTSEPPSSSGVRAVSTGFLRHSDGTDAAAAKKATTRVGTSSVTAIRLGGGGQDTIDSIADARGEMASLLETPSASSLGGVQLRLGRFLAAQGELTTTAMPSAGMETTTSTSSPPDSEMLLNGILRFSSSSDFRTDSVMEEKVTVAFRRGVAAMTSMEDRNIAILFAPLSVRRVRRLTAYLQVEYWLRCPNFWEALALRDRLSGLTTPETWSGVQDLLMQQLYLVGQPVQITLLGHYVNQTLEQLPAPPKFCPRGWATLDEEGGCTGQDGARVASGFIQEEDCCFVCRDVGGYAPASGRRPCLACGSFREINASGTGCELTLVPLVVIGAASLAAVLLLCGCGPLLPPFWLCILDAWDLRRRGTPCKCGRGQDCTCDRWKGKLFCFYSRCGGDSRLPQGHWVLRRPGKRVSAGLCPRCRNENCSFSSEENPDKDKDEDKGKDMGKAVGSEKDRNKSKGKTETKTDGRETSQKEATSEAWDKLKVECGVPEGTAVTQCFYIRDDQENVKAPPEFCSVNSRGPGQAYESENIQTPAQATGPKSPYREAKAAKPASSATPHGRGHVQTISPPSPQSHFDFKAATPKSPQNDVLAECQRDDSTIESPRDEEESLDIEPSLDNDNDNENGQVYEGGEGDEGYEGYEDYEGQEGYEGYEGCEDYQRLEGDEGEGDAHMELWDSLVEAFENCGEDFEAEADLDTEDLVMPTTEPR